MTAAAPTVIVVGASVSGTAVAETLAQRRPGTRVVLVDAEPHQPYDRPPLSKRALCEDTVDVGDIALRPAGTWQELGVELVLGRRAVRVDAPGRLLHLDDGTELGWDELVLATGLVPIVPRVLGEPAGLHVVRRWEDAATLRTALVPGARVVVVGGSFLGLEAAASARSRDTEVTVVEALEQPLAAGIGPRAAAELLGWHRDAGVVVRTGVAVVGVDRTAGRPSAVRLADGTTLPADVVVVSCGARPDTAWLTGSGLELDDGIVVDEQGATAVPHVWAVGDVARVRTAAGSVRSEHWTAAVEHGEAVGARLAGAEPSAEPPLPYLWTDQLGHKIQVLGVLGPDDVLHSVEQGPDGQKRCEVYTRDGRVTAVVTIDWPARSVRWRERVRTGEVLGEPAVDAPGRVVA